LQPHAINLVSEEARELLEGGHVEVLHYESCFFDCEFVRDGLSSKAFLLEYDTNTRCLLPDEDVISYVEGGLDVSNQESELSSGHILNEHHCEVFGVTFVILPENGVLRLPRLLLCVLGQVPPVVEASQFLWGDLILNHDLVSEALELVLGESLVHGDISSRLHLIEPKFSDFRHDLFLLLGREDSLDRTPCEINSLEGDGEGLQDL
jgi:hypothetical protein